MGRGRKCHTKAPGAFRITHVHIGLISHRLRRATRSLECSTFRKTTPWPTDTVSLPTGPAPSSPASDPAYLAPFPTLLLRRLLHPELRCALNLSSPSTSARTKTHLSTRMTTLRKEYRYLHLTQTSLWSTSRRRIPQAFEVYSHATLYVAFWTPSLPRLGIKYP